jgi:hypothetical protein
MHYSLLYAPSNEDGSWQLDGAPLNLNGLFINISHPRYLRSGQAVQDKTDARYALDPGLQLTGHVTDQNGKPIPPAHVTVGRDRWGRDDRPAVVDQDGNYVVYALKPESTWVTAEAPGFAPHAVQIDLNKTTKPVELQLKPGQTTRFRVVDRQGAPLLGIRLSADTWNGLRSLWWQSTTDVNGEAVWDGAPPDAVQFHFVSQRHMARRDLLLTPQDDPHIIVMTDQCKIQGIVTDDKKVKIPEFKVTLGYKRGGNSQMIWHYRGEIGRDGKFELAVTETYDEVCVRVEATGYRTWVSEPINTDVSPHKLFGKLERQSGPAGVVLSPDGKPVANAQLTLVTLENGLQYHAGFKPSGGKQTIASNDQGRFEFIAIDGEFLISAVSDDGYAEISATEFEKKHEVRLQSWSGLEVVTRRGSQPLPGAKIMTYPTNASLGRPRITSYGLDGQTDEEGRLDFSRVVPQPMRVCVILEQRSGPYTFNIVERAVDVQFKPGKKTKVELGGTGGTVKGRFEIAGKPPLTHHWQSNAPIEFRSQSGTDQYHTLVREDGSFELQDLPYGKYTLHLEVTAVADANQPFNRTRIGEVQRTFELTDAQPILDLGQVAGTFDKRVGPGDAVPFFIVRGMDHEPIRHSDLHGRLVLIDFWSGIRSNSKSEMKKLAALNHEFEDDPRFQILSLSVDTGSPPAEKANVKNQSWIFGYAGPLGSLVPNRFGIQQNMERFLIDADGTVLYRGIDLDQIAPLIRRRLEEWPANADLKPSTYTGLRPRIIQDSFISNQLIDVAAVVRPGDPGEFQRPSGQLLLWSADGKQLRTVDGIDLQRSALAIDAQRDRLYIYASNRSELIAFDRSGRQLFVTDVPDLYSFTIDERTGELWCLARNDNPAGELVILDSTGAEKSRYLMSAVELVFSPVDDAFWVTGEELQKIDRETKVLFRQPSPPESRARTLEVDRQQGGVWYIGGGAKDAKPLLRMTREGEQLEAHQFAEGEFPMRICSTEQGLWVVVARPPAKGVKLPLSSIPREIQLFDRDGKFMKRLEIAAQGLTRCPKSQNLWLQTDGKLLKVDSTGQTLQTILLPENTRSVMALAF